MKKTIAVLLTGCALLFAGCASDNSQANSQQHQPEKNPEVGMTKDQVIALYGKTDRVAASSEGEVWTYNLNMGEAFIPFNFGYRPKIRIITFDQDGKVAHWSYNK
jgi:hypothetical protein